MSTKPPNWKIGSVPGHVWLPFSRGIGANPADDVPRLIFADYLEGEGCHEYSEFIRVQIELAGMPPKRKNLGVTMGAPPTGVKVGGFIDLTLQTTGDGNPETFLRSLNMELGEIIDLFITSGDGGQWSEIRHAVLVYSYDSGRIRFRQTDLGPDPHEPRRNELTERQNHLLKTNFKEWISPLKQYTKSDFNIRHNFRRGFIDRLTLYYEMFSERGDHVLDVCPLTELTLTQLPVTNDFTGEDTQRFQIRGGNRGLVFGEKVPGQPAAGDILMTPHYDVEVESITWQARPSQVNIRGLTNSRGEMLSPPVEILRPSTDVTLKLGKRVWHPRPRKVMHHSTPGARR